MSQATSNPKKNGNAPVVTSSASKWLKFGKVIAKDSARAVGISVVFPGAVAGSLAGALLLMNCINGDKLSKNFDMFGEAANGLKNAFATPLGKLNVGEVTAILLGVLAVGWAIYRYRQVSNDSIEGTKSMGALTKDKHGNDYYCWKDNGNRGNDLDRLYGCESREDLERAREFDRSAKTTEADRAAPHQNRCKDNTAAPVMRG